LLLVPHVLRGTKKQVFVKRVLLQTTKFLSPQGVIMPKLPYLGFGLGLRPAHYLSILENQHSIDWFEIISEDYLVDGGNPIYYLDKIRANYPIVMHGVSLSVGGIDPLDVNYLKKLKALADRIQPPWVSDHLCWTSAHGINLHDLMPLPYTEESLKHVAERVLQVQDFLGRQLVLENPSSYVTYKHSTINEWDFLNELTKRTDCLLLLDVNNVYVSAFNHEFDPITYLDGIPASRVQQFHLAGHLNLETHIVDTHDQPIIADVWQLYAEAVRRFNPVSTMIERDDNIPPLQELVEELEQAKKIAYQVLP
jgi:uncharacterized protein (UPF0276 family)